MRLHDAFKMAAKRVQVVFGGSARASEGDRRLEAALSIRRHVRGSEEVSEQ